jgi:hypothetical protein
VARTLSTLAAALRTNAHSRREFVGRLLAACGVVAVSPRLWGASGGGPRSALPAACDSCGDWAKNFGPLQPPDANGVRLPAGFTSRIVARSGQRVVPSQPFLWHYHPDGGATFARPGGGWIYVSNCERGGGSGGVSALVFDAAGNVVDGYPICRNTSRNCAGGPTPWGTWLTCEEVDDVDGGGLVWECDPTGRSPAVARPALGTFKHEAAAVDPVEGRVYLTEDLPDGRLYRFTPSGSDLSAGLLEASVLVGADEHVERVVRWERVANPNPVHPATPTRNQVTDSPRFKGGEGIWWHGGVVYFATKGDNRIWAYDCATERVKYIYAPSSGSVLSGVDNVVVGRDGDVYVAEDGGDMQVVAVSSDGEAVPLLQIVGQTGSELAGPAFSPDGRRFYVSSQRALDSGGGSGLGLTYEITGPFVLNACEEWNGDFSTGDLSQWTRLQAADPDRFVLATPPIAAPGARAAARVTVQPGDWVSSGNRSQLVHSQEAREGSEHCYRWLQLLPQDFASVGETQTLLSLNRYDDVAAPPVTFRTQGEEVQLLVHGVVVWRGPLRRAIWESFTLQIKYSETDAGHVAFHRDDRLVLPALAARTHTRNYLKFGLYRSGSLASPTTVYLAGMRQGCSLQAVGAINIFSHGFE